MSFSFGKNWNQFVTRHFTPERLTIAQNHIAEFLELPSLTGKSVLDIGCGSGLSSLAFYNLGAERIVSFDLDPYSVQATTTLRRTVGDPDSWIVCAGSILDRDFVQSLAQADIVYSWGVLHHTGSMWNAVENTATLLKEDGLLYIALYTTTSKSPYWLRVKQAYNRATPVGKCLMELRYLLRYTILPELLRCKNPFRVMRDYQVSRGMDCMTDLRDWLGGYPYEDAKPEDVLRFARNSLGLELMNLATGEANTEYLFKKRS